MSETIFAACCGTIIMAAFVALAVALRMADGDERRSDEWGEIMTYSWALRSHGLPNNTVDEILDRHTTEARPGTNDSARVYRPGHSFDDLVMDARHYSVPDSVINANADDIVGQR